MRAAVHVCATLRRAEIAVWAWCVSKVGCLTGRHPRPWRHQADQDRGTSDRRHRPPVHQTQVRTWQRAVRARRTGARPPAVAEAVPPRQAVVAWQAGRCGRERVHRWLTAEAVGERMVGAMRCPGPTAMSQQLAAWSLTAEGSHPGSSTVGARSIPADVVQCCRHGSCGWAVRSGLRHGTGRRRTPG